MMQRALVRTPYIHARLLAHGLEPLQLAELGRVVLPGKRRGIECRYFFHQRCWFRHKIYCENRAKVQPQINLQSLEKYRREHNFYFRESSRKTTICCGPCLACA